MTELMTIVEKMTYNLRHELARHVWAARKGTLDVFEANENTRDLVALMPSDIMDAADKLQHKVLGQITKKYGKICLTRKGIACDDVRVPKVDTRKYLGSVQLPAGMVGSLKQ